MTPNLATYLDYNASAPLRIAAKDALLEALSFTGNPSSIHSWGREQRARLDKARARIKTALGTKSAHVIFTSGGTEANNLALRGPSCGAIFVGATSHASTLMVPGTAPIPVDGNGLLDLGALGSLLTQAPQDHPCLVSVSLANHETGVLQPFDALTQIAKSHGALVHCDASQAVGRTPVSFDDLGVDLMTVSSPKVGGPPGVGALLTARSLRLEPLLWGGGQEFSWRSGTQNTPGIWAFTAALEACLQDDWTGAERARDALEARLINLGAESYGKDTPRLPNTLCVRMPGVRAEDQVMAFDVEGFGVSAGAACSSGKVTASSVLMAMGHTDGAKESLRLSLGPTPDLQALDAFYHAWQRLFERARSHASHGKDFL